MWVANHVKENWFTQYSDLKQFCTAIEKLYCKTGLMYALLCVP